MKLKVVVGLIVLAILTYTVFGEHGLLKLVRYNQRLAAMDEQAQIIEKENERLKREIDLLSNDSAYLERIIREEVGLVRPGELVLQFTEPKEGR